MTSSNKLAISGYDYCYEHVQQIDLLNALQRRVYHLKTGSVLITDYALINGEIGGGVCL